MSQSQLTTYGKLEKIRLSIDQAIGQVYADRSKQTILKTLEQIRRYGYYAEEIAIICKSHGVLDAKVLSSIRQENTDVDHLIALVRRNDPVIGEWTLEKFEGMINGFADSYNRAFEAETTVS